MADFVNTVDIVGDEALTNSIINKTITQIADNNTRGIGAQAFCYCQALISANFPEVTNIGIQAFQYCKALVTAYCPRVTNIADYVFYHCEKLTAVDFPLLTRISSGAFSNCGNLSELNLPIVTSLSSSAFEYCTKLTFADFPLVTSIGIQAFRGARRVTLILRNATMCTLSDKNAFQSTYIESGSGYIYVPAALVDSYKVATNWSNFANQFRALEDYTVDGTTTGALDPAKI